MLWSVIFTLAHYSKRIDQVGWTPVLPEIVSLAGLAASVVVYVFGTVLGLLIAVRLYDDRELREKAGPLLIAGGIPMVLVFLWIGWALPLLNGGQNPVETAWNVLNDVTRDFVRDFVEARRR